MLDTRCERVDFLNDDVLRRGDWVERGDENEKLVLRSPYCLDGSSITVRGAGVWSNMLSKSFPRLDAPCRLRRFAIGLVPVLPLRFINPSLRFSGLDFAGGAGERSGRRPNSNLMGLSLTSRCLSMSTVFGESALGRRAGVFSCPVPVLAMNGVALPRSVESASTRRRGLLELLVRVRGDERKGAERRSENFFFAGGACVPRGDSGYVVTGLVGLCAFGLKARARARGEIGDLGESELRSWKREGLEGERDSERRSCWR